MAPRKPTSTEWHRQQNGTWARSFGVRGYRVRLFQKRREGVFYRAVYVPGTNGCSRKSLETSVKVEAERLARQLVAELLRNTGTQAAGVPDPVPASDSRPASAAGGQPVTISALWNRYSRECEDFLDNNPGTRADAERSARLLMSVLGAHRDVRTLSPRDLTDYAAHRRRGGIQYRVLKRGTGEGLAPDMVIRTARPVRQTAIHRDLTTLRTMLRWARRVVTLDGTRWLEADPLDGLRFERERNPKRPLASRARYEAARGAAHRLARHEAGEQARLRWTRLELALFLAYTTGRRRGAIVGLRWEDINCAQRRITWRAEHDKKRVEWVTPVSAQVIKELRRFRTQIGATGGFLFPSKRNPSGHLPADMLDQWLRDLEARAKLPKLSGGLWHPYRRGWATERMHFPLKAVADAGGWKDITTLVRCYQQTDEDTLLAVMSNNRALPYKKPGDAGARVS